MKTLIAIMMLTLIASAQSSGREPGVITPISIEAIETNQNASSRLPPEALEQTPTFLTLDITIDPQGQTLAAYQFELTSQHNRFTVVGVEAGDNAAFNHGRPPYFDPVAKQGEIDRLILAEYALPELDADDLPTQAVRVATVHVMLTASLHEQDNPSLQLTLTTAGNADGKRIDAQISHTFRTPGLAPERPE